MEKQKFNIQGMTCSSCSSHVEKAVKNLDGVKEVNVNLLSNNMNVVFDENKITKQNIIDAVTSAGYGATIPSEQKAEDVKLNNDETSQMKKRLIVSIIFLIPLMYISMNHMLKMYLKIPVPNFIVNLFNGTENALIFAFTQFLLLLPIIIVNRNFFIIRI